MINESQVKLGISSCYANRFARLISTVDLAHLSPIMVDGSAWICLMELFHATR